MILSDTSAWVEFLRDNDLPCAKRWTGSSATRLPPATRMEVPAGSRGDDHLRSLRGLLAPATMLPKGPADYETSASLHRACRQAGGTVRKLIDCLVGAVAIS